MSTLSAVLTDLIRAAATAAGHADAPVPLDPCVPTNDSRHGDYQSNFAFRLGKALRTNPRAVAESIVAHIPENDIIAKAEVAGPGFVNLTLADAWLAQNVLENSDVAAATPQIGADKTVVIDFSSPNVAKRMHVGHLRSTVIGNALARLHRFCGYTVVSDNHIGDWGTQFGMLIAAWGTDRNDDAYAADPVAELQRLYQDYKKRIADDSELLDIARAETAKLQAGDPASRALWEEFVRVSLDEYGRMYDRLGVTFDVTLGESFYNPVLAELVSGLLERGIAEVDDGAVIVRFTNDDGKGLGKNPLLIRKSDGASLYGTTDLATIDYRQKTWGPDRVLYVTDVRQQLHFRQLFAAAKKIGWDNDFQHVWFGMLRLPGGEVAATRSGVGETLSSVLDTAVAHARTVVDGKSGDLPEDERAAIAEAVGIGAILYTDLSQNPQTDITFEWDKMLALEGNTAPYLMYALARIRSIFRKVGVTVAPGPIQFTDPVERELAILVRRTPVVIGQACENFRPNFLAEHLFQVANTFASFYGQCPVIVDDADLRASRLALCNVTAEALTAGLRLLGLTPLERM